MTAETVRREIERITADLIEAGLCIDQNFPSLKAEGAVTSVSFSGLTELSYTLKNVPYAETYERLNTARSFNLRLIDGGIVQFLYRFQGATLLKHRLAFFPSPSLLEYQNASEIYDNDELYGDIISKSIVTVPVRFDYDPDAFVDMDHPRSHVTLGQYKSCRIAVSGPISPFHFVHFILKSFYNTPFKNFCADMRQATHSFGNSITDQESRYLHLRLI